MHHVSELAKTRRFTPPPDPVTTKFVKIDDDLTVPFTPYDSLEIEVIEVPPEAPACERALVSDTTAFARPSEPYERITIQPIAGPPILLRPLLIACLLIGSFACGVGAAFAL